MFSFGPVDAQARPWKPQMPVLFLALHRKQIDLFDFQPPESPASRSREMQGRCGMPSGMDGCDIFGPANSIKNAGHVRRAATRTEGFDGYASRKHAIFLGENTTAGNIFINTLSSVMSMHTTATRQRWRLVVLPMSWCVLSLYWAVTWPIRRLGCTFPASPVQQLVETALGLLGIPFRERLLRDWELPASRWSLWIAVG